jgi:hypothetical protein
MNPPEAYHLEQIDALIKQLEETLKRLKVSRINLEEAMK